MTIPLTKMRSATLGGLARLAAAPTLRYGVVVVIVVSMAFSWGHLLPVVRHDLVLLQDVYVVDERGIRLEGDLQYEIQESRRKFLRILLANGDPAELEQEIRSMRSYDATIALTESTILQLRVVPEHSQQQFHERWESYMALRDKLLATAFKGNQKDVRKIDTDLGKGAFEAVEQTVRNSEAAFQASSAKHIGEVSTTLNEGIKELFSFMALRVLALALLVWTDWRRVRAEKQLQRTTHELQISEDRFHQAYESAEVGMGLIKLDGTVFSANAKAAQILGYEVSELIGMKVSQFMAPEFVEDHLHKFATVPNTPEKSYQTERRVLRKDGTEAWVRNSVTLLMPEGQEAHYFSISEEITLQHQAHERLAFLANYDPVTGLPNRHFFEEQLAGGLQPVAGKPDCAALLYLEVDSFDFLKATFGRTVADEVLSELGSNLAAFQQKGEIVGRLDDHVFGMLIRAAPYDEATMVRAGELRDLFRKAGEFGKHRIPLSASIGVAFAGDGIGDAAMPRPSESGSGSRSSPRSATRSDTGADTLLKYARAAMLEARSRGGDSIYVADPSLQERAAQRHQIESALLHGLREDEFRVVFQPQFQVATGKLVRFEALCRWNSAELGSIPPDRFIPIAEQTGLIMEIGRRVMRDALRQAKTWSDSGRRIGVAINISPMQFMRPDFTHVITEILASSQFPPALLELEITEGIFIRDLNLAVSRIRELQRLGLSIALDDFGTGYSSLSYLQRMPIDAVKLDRSFVSDLTTDAGTVSMVRSVLAMAEALNLRVVTEGVETEQQLEILRALGCDEAQGYLLGRPESSELALQRVLESPMPRVSAVN